MKIFGFIWLEEIVEKLAAKHQVAPEEVEQVFDNQPRVKRMNKGHFRGEDVYRVLGQTDTGRYLVIFFIHKLTREAMILSAPDMDDKERKSYAREEVSDTGCLTREFCHAGGVLGILGCAQQCRLRS